MFTNIRSRESRINIIRMFATKIIQGETNYFFIVKVFERPGSDIRALFFMMLCQVSSDRLPAF